MVEQGCSGISSLLSTLACVLFYVLWNRISWIRGSLLTLSSIFWVLVNNITRIVGITFFGVGFNLFGNNITLNLSEGAPHQIFGIVLFLLTLFMLWSTDRFLMFLGQSDLPKRRTEPMPATSESLQSSWRMTLAQPTAWLMSYGIAGAFGVLVAMQALDLYALFVRLPYSGSALAKLYEDVDLNTMPERFGPWHRGPDLQKLARPAGDPLGQYSRAWHYRANQAVQASLSLDYPYPEFHDLRVCYMMQGWKFDSVESFDVPTDNQTQHCILVRMHKPNERFAILMYCSFDQDGFAVDPSLEADVRTVQERSIWDRATARFTNRIHQWKKAFGPASEQTTGMGSILQVQLLLATNEPMPDAGVAEVRKLFAEGVTRLRKRCIELKSGAPVKAPEEQKKS
jgi:exosortase/archaeosortase family protein